MTESANLAETESCAVALCHLHDPARHENARPYPGPEAEVDVASQPAPGLNTGPLLRLPAGCRLKVEDRSEEVLEIVKGAVMLSRGLGDGRRQVLELLGPGDLLSGLEGHRVTIKAISAVALRNLRRGGQLRDRLVAQLASRISAMHELSLLVGRKSASERIATLLLLLAARFGRRVDDCIVIPLDLTQADLGDHLGLGVETVCRELSKLRRDGALAPYRPGEIVIMDEAVLRQASEQMLPPKSYRRSQPRLQPSRAKPLAAVSTGEQWR